MNEKQSFIIEDLDDYHVVIKADDKYRVRKELDIEVRLVSFVTPPQTTHFGPCCSSRKIPTTRSRALSQGPSDMTFCFNHLDFCAQVIYSASSVKVQPIARHSKPWTSTNLTSGLSLADSN
jgi:hypothetical protein